MMTTFSADDSALGYYYQGLYALLLILDEKEEASVAIENLDDVEVIVDGQTIELMQLKHHIKSIASLSNLSSDLWKTLRIWSTYVHEELINPEEVKLLLITTARASESSVASKLTRPNINRDNEEIVSQLLDLASSSTNSDLKSSFAAFEQLQPNKRLAMVSSIMVIDNSPDIVDIEKRIKNKLIAVRQEHVCQVYERLLGWWTGVVVKSFTVHSAEKTISRKAVLDKIASVNEQFLPEALPIDYRNAIPPATDNIWGEDRLFIKQMRSTGISTKRIEKAVLDYYRAYQQRSKWLGDSLIIDDELENYEKKLIEEWERYYDYIKNKSDYDDTTEERCRDIGKEVYRWMEFEADICIRKNVTEDYIMRGSYQILADILPPKVWWHPKFVEQILSTLGVEG
jgi:hypothetical protein